MISWGLSWYGVGLVDSGPCLAKQKDVLVLMAIDFLSGAFSIAIKSHFGILVSS